MLAYPVLTSLVMGETEVRAGTVMWTVHAAAMVLVFSKPAARFFQPNPNARFFRVAGSRP